MDAARPSSLADNPQLGTDQAAESRRLWEDGKRYFRRFYEAYSDDLDFVLKLEHYLRGSDNTSTRDRRRIKYRGRELFAKHRRKVAQITDAAINLKCRPVDDASDLAQRLAEDARWLLEHEKNDPSRKLRRVLRRLVSSAVAARVGAMALDVDWEARPFPKVLPRFVDPRHLSWTPGWQDPDDPTCPWVAEEFVMRLEDVRAMADQGWKNVEDVKPDDGRRIIERAGDASQPLRTFAAGQPGPGPWNRLDSATGVRIWYRRNEGLEKGRTRKVEVLPPERRYYACTNGQGCDYRERPQDGDGSTLPVQGGPCPLCGSPIERIDAEKITEDRLSYPDGRLVISFPVSNVLVYDGKWPLPLRDVPLFLLKCYDHPLEPWGQGDGSIDRGAQLVSNSIMRRIYERASGVSGVVIYGQGLEDPETKEPFQFTDEPIQLAKWVGQGAPAVQFFDASGNPAALVAAYNVIQQNFRADMGTGEVGLGGSAEQLKGVAVGAVEHVAASGEIPIGEHVAELREVLSTFFGVWFDMKRAISTRAELVAMKGPAGELTYKRIKAAALPNVSVEVTDEDNWAQFDAEKADAIQKLLSAPPPMRRVLARAFNIPPGIIDELEQAEANMPPPAQPGPARPGPAGPAPGSMPAPGIGTPVALTAQQMGA